MQGPHCRAPAPTVALYCCLAMLLLNRMDAHEKGGLAANLPFLTNSTRCLPHDHFSAGSVKSGVLADFMPGSGIGLRISSIPKSTLELLSSRIDRL